MPRKRKKERKRERETERLVLQHYHSIGNPSAQLILPPPIINASPAALLYPSLHKSNCMLLVSFQAPRLRWHALQAAGATAQVCVARTTADVVLRGTIAILPASPDPWDSAVAGTAAHSTILIVDVVNRNRLLLWEFCFACCAL